MPSLKQYRDRIASVKSTRKITSAMKMVAASKLRKAQEQAEASQPYARAMQAMLTRLASAAQNNSAGPRLLVGTGQDTRHLLVVMSSDRGLCGGFNANLIRFVRAEVKRLQDMGKDVKICCVGRKGRDGLRRTFPGLMVDSFVSFGARKRVQYEDADQVAQYILAQFAGQNFDVVTLVYNEFRSVLLQKPVAQQIIPFTATASVSNDNAPAITPVPYTFEPDEGELLAGLLPKNIGVQVFRAMIDSAAGEQAARMTAMDNATRNAGDLIKRLTLDYNRARQAYITKELIEIISGAEAV
ncbi:MAG: F0F1 ATP synthase subunit gamma [Pseudomonadota bacterium]